MRPSLKEQLFENLTRPALRVGNKKTKWCLIGLSALFHLIIALIILPALTLVTNHEPNNASKQVAVSLIPVYFYNPEYSGSPPPPPLVKQRPGTKNTDKKSDKPGKSVHPAPVKNPSEIKPGPSPEPKGNSSDNTKDPPAENNSANERLAMDFRSDDPRGT